MLLITKYLRLLHKYIILPAGKNIPIILVVGAGPT